VRKLGGLTGVLARMTGMRVGVIDVGSNTVRLLVASVAGDDVRSVREERQHLGLGEEILLHGRVRRSKLDEVRDVTGEYARIARKLGVRELETVVTAPGRQGDSPERLLDAIGRATAGEVRVVSAEDEGRLAFSGAVSRANPGEAVVAVCDVGGGSTEVVVGTELLGPAWVRSVDLGSLRLTASLLHSDPPSAAEIDSARKAVRSGLADLEPPQPDIALGTGGSARALARVIGHEYGPAELESIVGLLASRPAAESADALGVRPTRAHTLLAGALILEEVSRLLGQPFMPSRGGIREGAALRLAARHAAAA
jgi:exopolyphosphatase / guanosine-5'-triphosphate,3'-diphosphate pyrophosphatase